MANEQVSLKEHIEKLFDEFKDRYASERRSASNAFEVFKDGLDEKTKLQAAEYERRLTAYPTIKDFNDLKENVTIEFSAALGRGKALPLVVSIVSVILAAGAVGVAIWK